MTWTDYIVDIEQGKPRLRHIAIAEAALGKPLPDGAEVHHVNEITTDNRPENLVICENRAYHRCLHARTRVLMAGGNPDIEGLCTNCQQVKPLGSFSLHSNYSNGHRPICKQCRAKIETNRKQARRLSQLVLS
jgi:hypothetical protein